VFERLNKLIKGFLSLFISGLETANPKALLEAEIQALHEAVANYNRNLAKQAALVEKLRAQVEREKKEVDLLTARATALYNARQMDKAGPIALQLKQRRAQLSENENQLKQGDELYRNLTKQRDVYVLDAQKRIENIKQKMSRAEIAEAQAQLAEIATATSFNLAGSGATLERLEEKLDERVASALGKARVASDSATTGDWAAKAEEEAALQSQALSEFATAMGLTPPTPAAPQQEAEPAVRDLGPAQTT